MPTYGRRAIGGRSFYPIVQRPSRLVALTLKPVVGRKSERILGTLGNTCGELR